MTNYIQKHSKNNRKLKEYYGNLLNIILEDGGIKVVELKLKSYIKVMKAIQVTQNEINQATRPNVYRSKKHYTRKSKHKII